ncbi:ATP-dependent RNA helicase RhlE [mine drainage metagenome]|uniref:ATP-dependent RNA helicase RhlE n=1 Tax=mine drainage metagenome TaxID=410659 RepID=A0A1J5RYS9_9ZZZZ
MHNDPSTVTFSSLALSEPIQRAIAEKGYTTPSPIQAKTIPHLLEGRDLIGLAQTGTGKTAAFALPLLDRLHRNPVQRQTKRPRALVLTPTRELAIQIGENIARYGKHLQVRHTLVFGGVGEHPQIKSVAVGTDILVATPGRLLDLMSQRHVMLDRIEVFILDEADRMLDMGFAPDVKRIIAQLPPKRQSLLFSATMPESIREIAGRLLVNPVVVEVAPVGTTAELIDQKVCFVARSQKHRLLLHILSRHEGQRVLVFSRTKHGANRLAKNLSRDGVRADAIHGDKTQGARQRALGSFRDGTVPVLVATDIAARGIDVKEIGLVVNFDLPEEPEAYVHRIGRTARAGASGLAVAFCDHEERSLLRDIQKLIRKTIPVDNDHPFVDGDSSQQPQQDFQRQPRQQGRPQHRQSSQQQRSRQPQAESRSQRPAAHAPAHAPAQAHHRDGRHPQGQAHAAPAKATSLRSRLFSRFGHR